MSTYYLSPSSLVWDGGVTGWWTALSRYFPKGLYTKAVSHAKARQNLRYRLATAVGLRTYEVDIDPSDVEEL